jgi:hypothetical protein
LTIVTAQLQELPFAKGITNWVDHLDVLVWCARKGVKKGAAGLGNAL